MICLPPELDVDDPDDNITSPPVPLSPSPIVTYTDPLRPECALPVPMKIEPLTPELDVPVLKAISPLAPPPPAFIVDINNDPLVDDELYPL
jgi:hypothetical protein